MDADTSLSMSKVSLTVNKAALLAVLLLIEGQLLPFDAGERVLMGTEVGDIRNDARVFEVN